MTADNTLLHRWKTERDPAAFAELVRRHSGMVYRAAYRVLCSAEEAEEVAQECFIKLAQSPRIRRSAGGWLHAIAVNRAIDRQRSEHARKAREQRYATASPNDESLGWTEIQALVEEAVAALPADLRDTVACRFLEGCTLEETALRLGVARSTVQVRLDKAVSLIRDFLRGRGVAISVATVSAALGAGAADAAPPTLTLALGKLALAGTAGTASVPTTLVATMGGLIVAKKIVLVTAVFVAAVGGWMALRSTTSSSPATKTMAAADVARENADEETAAADATTSDDSDDKSSFFSSLADLVTPEKPCTVSGKVVDPTGRPVENVRVSAEGLGGFSESTTDVAGQFKLTGLKAGRNRISARKWPTTTVSVRGDDGHPVERRPAPIGGNNEKRLVLQLEPEEQRKDVRILYDRSWTISGHVYDTDGAPIANVQLLAGSVKTGGSYARSLDDGSYVIEDLVEDDYQIDAIIANYQQGARRSVAAGSTDVDFVLDPAFVVEGRVIDDDTGAPVKHFEAALSHTAKEDGGLNGMLLYQMQAFDDPQGRFILSTIQPGFMAVAVRIPGYATEWQNVTLNSDHPSEYVELYVAKGGALRGFVRDTAGKPVKGVHILYGIFTVDLMQAGDTVETDENGMFALSQFPRRDQRITAYHRDYAFADILVPATHDPDRPVELTLTRGGVVEGTVRVEEPLEGSEVQVSVTPQSGHFSRNRGRATLPAAGGHFSIGQLQPGLSTLHVRASQTALSGQLRLIEQPVLVYDGETVEVNVDLPPGRSTIEGTVPRALADHALIQLRWNGPTREEIFRTTPAADGTFRIEGVPEGSGDLEVRENRAGTEDNPPFANTTVSLTDGETLRFEFPGEPDDSDSADASGKSTNDDS